VSLDTNPEPVTVTDTPTAPEEGERTIVASVAVVTANVASTKSFPPAAPVTRTEYGPTARPLATTKLPVKVPVLVDTIVHDAVLMDMPDPAPPPTVHVVSPVAGRIPEKLTSVPGGPEDGLSTSILVPTATTVNVVEAESPEDPVPITVQLCWATFTIVPVVVHAPPVGTQVGRLP
jgi:hypothetical protein